MQDTTTEVGLHRLTRENPFARDKERIRPESKPGVRMYVGTSSSESEAELPEAPTDEEEREKPDVQEVEEAMEDCSHDNSGYGSDHHVPGVRTCGRFVPTLPRVVRGDPNQQSSPESPPPDVAPPSFDGIKQTVQEFQERIKQEEEAALAKEKDLPGGDWSEGIRRLAEKGSKPLATIEEIRRTAWEQRPRWAMPITSTYSTYAKNRAMEYGEMCGELALGIFGEELEIGPFFHREQLEKHQLEEAVALERSKKDEVIRRLRRMEAEIEDLRAAKKAQDELRIKRHELNIMQGQLDTAHADNQNINDKLTQTQGELADTIKEREKWKQELKNTEEAHITANSRAMAETQRKEWALKGELEKIRGALEQQEVELGKSYQGIMALQQELASLTANFKADLREKDEMLEQTYAKMNQMESVIIAELDKELRATREERATLKKELEEAHREQEEAKNELEGARKDLDETQEELEEITRKMENLQRRADNQTERLKKQAAVFKCLAAAGPSPVGTNQLPGVVIVEGQAAPPAPVPEVSGKGKGPAAEPPTKKKRKPSGSRSNTTSQAVVIKEVDPAPTPDRVTAKDPTTLGEGEAEAEGVAEAEAVGVAEAEAVGIAEAGVEAEAEGGPSQADGELTQSRAGNLSENEPTAVAEEEALGASIKDPPPVS